MNLEDDLRRAFGRRPAPLDLAEKVLARLGEAPRSGRTASQRRRVARGLAAAAAIAILAAGGARYYRHQQAVAEADHVQRQVRLALEIAGEKLALAQRKLEEFHK
jgi:hypothetical protein